MRAVVQRVSKARVTVAGETTGEIDAGFLVLLGVAQGDTEADAQWLAEKICALRVFEDEAGKMNRSLRDLDATGATAVPATIAASASVPAAKSRLLVVSQFTLFASTRKGTRPSFNDAARPELAIPLYETFCRFVSNALGRPVATGKFGAMMEVSLVNDGPVTLIIDSKARE